MVNFVVNAPLAGPARDVGVDAVGPDRNGGRGDHVDLFQDGVEVALDERPQPLRLDVLHRGPQHRPGDAVAETLSIEMPPRPDQRGVGRGLLGADDRAEGRPGVAEIGQGDVPHLGAEPTQRRDGVVEQLPHAGLNALVQVPPRDADTELLDAALKAGGVERNGAPRRGRVLGIVAGDDVESGGGPFHRPRERAGVVEAPGEGKDAAPAHPSIGGLDADTRGEGGGDADRTSGVAAHGGEADAGGNGCPRTAAGKPGDAVKVPGVAGPAVAGAGEIDGELGEVRLAEDDRAGVEQALDGEGMLRGHVIEAGGRGAGGGRAGDVVEVLDRDGEAVQGAAVDAAGDLLLGDASAVVKLMLAVDVDEGVDLRLDVLEARDDDAHQLDGGEAAALDEARRLGDRQVAKVEVGHVSLAAGGSAEAGGIELAVALPGELLHVGEEPADEGSVLHAAQGHGRRVHLPPRLGEIGALGQESGTEGADLERETLARLPIDVDADLLGKLHPDALLTPRRANGQAVGGLVVVERQRPGVKPPKGDRLRSVHGWGPLRPR